MSRPGPGTWWRTARHLRWQQLVLRPLYPLRRPAIDERPPPSRRALTSPWCPPARRAPSLVQPTTWSLLGDTHALDAVGWDDPTLPLLWRYNQHYFDDLNALDADERRAWHVALIERWIDDNPPGRGTGWAPYPTSLRITNWVKWALSGGPTPPRMLQSLAVQARWLARRIEWHVLGNHLFANAKALWLAGRFFDGVEADAWCAAAVSILDPALSEQVLADGGQFERSPMYHALAFEDVLDLINVLRCTDAATCALRTRLERIAPAMHRWLRCLTHPDGTLARFNDTADGIAPPVDELARVARQLGTAFDDALPNGLTPLIPSGYVRAAHGDAVTLLDVAPVAPDYLMAHGHADTLAFELSVHGRRVVVNGGTSRYGSGPVRQLERSTWSHSTVTVDGEDSSEVWSSFRVGRRARVLDLTVGDDFVVASHDGYTHRPGAPVHRRRWQLGTTSLRVDDTVTAISAPAVARYHLAPGLNLQLRGDRRFAVTQGSDELARVIIEEGVAARGLSRFSPRFGEVVPTVSLDVSLQQGRASTSWHWD